MKLINKILPLVCVASTAAITAPLTTSCAQAKWYFADMKKIDAGQYERITDIKKATDFTNLEDALTTYLKDIANNDQIYADDVFEWSHNILVWVEGRTSAEWKLSNFTGQCGLKASNINIDEMKMSSEFDLDISFNAVNSNITSEPFTLDLKLHGYIKNIKLDIKCETDGDNNTWYITTKYLKGWVDPSKDPTRYVDFWMLQQDKHWSISFDGVINAKNKSIPDFAITNNLNGNYDYAANDVTSLTLIEAFFSTIWHESKYLSQAKLK